MASPRFSIDIKSLLLRAEQCRLLGNGMRAGSTRDNLLKTAIYYQRLAKEIQLREVTGRKQLSK